MAKIAQITEQLDRAVFFLLGSGLSYCDSMTKTLLNLEEPLINNEHPLHQKADDEVAI